MKEDYNLLFIFTDEQAASTMQIYGNKEINTPNMNRLARESLVFKQAYVSQPVCTPSRSTLLTGLYPHANGCVENNISLTDDRLCFPELCDFSQYQTGYFGKWHLGDEIFVQHGFEQWRSVDDSYRRYYSKKRDKFAHSTYYHFLIENGFEPDHESSDGFKSFSRMFCTDLPEEYTKPAYLAAETNRFLEDNKNNPFILFLNFFEPHSPYYSPRDNQYDPDEIKLPENFYHESGDDTSLRVSLMQEVFKSQDEQEWREERARYWGLVSLVDTYLGKILDKLETLGLDENTIIVYTSDHGALMGSHQLESKAVMYEEASRVPLLLKIPGLEKEEQEIKHPFSHIDLVPTLLDIMGQEIPSFLQGYSWLPYLKDEEKLTEEDVFIEWNGPNGFNGAVPRTVKYRERWSNMITKEEIKQVAYDPIRTIITPEGWKLNYSKRGDHELYNLIEDPGEQNNLAFEKEYRNLIDELYQKIVKWQRRTRDPVYL